MEVYEDGPFLVHFSLIQEELLSEQVLAQDSHLEYLHQRNGKSPVGVKKTDRIVDCNRYYQRLFEDSNIRPGDVTSEDELYKKRYTTIIGNVENSICSEEDVLMDNSLPQTKVNRDFLTIDSLMEDTVLGDMTTGCLKEDLHNIMDQFWDTDMLSKDTTALPDIENTDENNNKIACLSENDDGMNVSMFLNKDIIKDCSTNREASDHNACMTTKPYTQAHKKSRRRGQLHSSKAKKKEKNYSNPKKIEKFEKPRKHIVLPCPRCNKTFRKKAYLVDHMHVHFNIKPYACETCGKQFCKKSVLQRHTKIHTDTKSFRCDRCLRCFRRNDELTRHKRIHSDSKPFVCEQCGHQCCHRYDLVKHKRVHGTEKQHVCNKCGKSFRQRGGLLYHTRAHIRDEMKADVM